MNSILSFLLNTYLTCLLIHAAHWTLYLTLKEKYTRHITYVKIIAFSIVATVILAQLLN